MDLTPHNLARLREDFRILAVDSFTTSAPLADTLCQVERTGAESVVYNIMVQWPAFRRFRGKVVEQPYADVTHRIVNDEWENTVTVKQADVERDTIGKYTNLFRMMGASARYSPDQALAQMLKDAFTVVDYTGTPFFAADKPHIPGVVDSGTFTNVMTEKPSAQSWEKAKLLLGSIKDANGRPMALGAKRRVVCGQKWESTFKRILNAELLMQVSGGAGAAVSNIYRGDAELTIFPWLTGDEWVVLDESFPLRSFILQKETDLRWFAQDNPNVHKDAFEQHIFKYQGYYRGEVGYGMPQLCVGSTGSAAAL